MAMFSEACLEAVTNKEKIKYLKRFSILDKEIDRKIEELAYWRERLGQITSTVSATPRSGGCSIYSKTESIVAKILDLEQELNEDIDKLVEIKKNITEIIEQVEDDQLRLLLHYRYIDSKTFEWIAGELGLSWQWVHELHKKALRKIS